MFVKLTVFACALVACQAVWTGPLAGGVPASQFPAGISPQACPNYPNCHNPAVAANPNQAAPYNAAPQWNANNYNPQPVPQWNPGLQGALDRGEYTGDGDYHGEGLAESGAYGNNGAQWNNGGGQWNGGANQWNNGGGQWNGGAANQWNGGAAQQWNQPAAAHGVPAQIPAGVDARSCPNYPFCHA